jgi:hypothetical protein
MFGLNAHGPAGKREVNRRQFLSLLGSAFGASALFGLFGRAPAPVRSNFYRRAWRQRDFNGEPITVYKMVALPGRKYAKADGPHMANKIFPSLEAARARRQHQAFVYGLKRIELPRPLVNGMDRDTLFCGRKDLDCRVAKDRRHWQRLGVDIEVVFRMVRDA